jgi:demethylmenaquinone methyltransferase/2-methoxy-6-polyprenyl-1,4-benzoquinol methylase
MDRLAEQKEYYRHRAPEYDQWWQRRGQYEVDPGARERWFADVREVEQALDDFGPAGDVLELAAGTGWWTERLARHARQVTAVDASGETLELNRRRAGPGGNVTYVQADIFAWTPPPAGFDVVFFSFWLSHVPDERLAGFWRQVAGALRPGGRVFLVDSYHHERLDGDVQPRVLTDGRRFEVVKRFWQPDELTTYAAGVGWRLDTRTTRNQSILYAAGRPAGDS